MFLPLFRAVSQLGDAVLLGVVWRSLLLSLLAFAGLLIGSVALLDQWAGQGGWTGALAGGLGGFGVLLLAIWFYVPVALLIATLYIDRVADAVERRFYPGLAAAKAATLAEQGWDGVILALQVGALQVATLIASVMLPGIGLVLGYAVTGWAIGRGLFVAVAMRRMTRPAALGAYRARRPAVIVPGIALAVVSTIPPLNLLVPVVGIASMVHVLCDVRSVARPRSSS